MAAVPPTLPISIFDIEQSPQTGYPALGDFLAADPDGESLVFRKFDRLAARNLLSLQSEVIALEAESKVLDQEICLADQGVLASVGRWESLVEAAEKDANSVEFRYLDLTRRIRPKIKEYHEALMLASAVSSLERPNKRVLKILRDWFSGKTRGQRWPIIGGKAKTMLDDEDDLVALHVATEKDTLTRFVQDHWVLEGKPGPYFKDGTRYFRRRHVSRTVALISTVVAATELVGAIVSLFYIRDPGARLGVISAWTIGFGLSLRLLTNAKRAEIFASSAAFAAVLVVFVSGDLAGHGSPEALKNASVTVYAGNISIVRGDMEPG
ncbi:hypothetical protein QBC44DRAFT_332719 [Cladorrhinum sp. PSN332]|nr:hypothetical protein QBC44DRAFT_332719 [Cladorrhinum sp. PSN332]